MRRWTMKLIRCAHVEFPSPPLHSAQKRWAGKVQLPFQRNCHNFRLINALPFKINNGRRSSLPRMKSHRHQPRSLCSFRRAHVIASRQRRGAFRDSDFTGTSRRRPSAADETALFFKELSAFATGTVNDGVSTIPDPSSRRTPEREPVPYAPWIAGRMCRCFISLP